MNDVQDEHGTEVIDIGLPLTDQDQADIDSMDLPYFAILKVWTELLRPSVEQAKERIDAAWSSKICAQYPQITFAAMKEYQARYFGKIARLKEILAAEIATDDDCLDVLDAAEDAERNAGHYKNLLRDWQLEFQLWDLQWDYADPYAACELASISECHKMFFSQQGIVSFLDQIQLEYTEQDQADLAVALDEARVAHLGQTGE